MTDLQGSDCQLKAVQDFIDYCWSRNVKPDARQVLLMWVPRSEAEALAEALEKIKRATTIEDSSDVDPMTQYRQVKQAEAIAAETLDQYRVAYPREETP